MTFLERFFGAGNAIPWAEIQDPASEKRRKLEPFLGLVERGANVAFLPRTLPATSGQSGHLRWYFLCRDAAGGRRAREVMKAFLGPSFVQLPDRLPRLSAADPVEGSVLDEFGPTSFWVAVPSQWPNGSPMTEPPHEVVRTRLEKLAALMERRPVRTLVRRRPVGRVLRDFEYAVTASDVESASACLAELAAAGDLTAANRQFLAVRIDWMRKAWDALLDPPRVAEILHLGPPRAVVQALVDAFYAKHLQEFDDPGRAVEALARFKALRPTYGGLFRSRAGLSGRPADVCFMLEAAGFADQPGPAIESILLGAPEGSPGRATLVAVAALAAKPPAPPVDPTQQLNRALERYAIGDLDEALRLALFTPHGFRRTALLVRIAAELGTLEPVAAALQALEESSKQDLNEIARTKLLADAASEVRGLVSGRPGEPEPRLPSGWLEWLERLRRPEPWMGAVAAATAGEKGWDLDTVVGTPEGIDRFMVLLGCARPVWGEQAFRDAAPYLVRALTSIQQGPSLRPVHEALFLQIATDQDVSTPQWSALADLVDLQASYGMSESSYAQEVDVLGELLEPLGSTPMVLPALSLFERLCELPTPSREALLRFATRLQAMMSSLYGKIDRSDLVLFASLARRVGLEVTVPRPDEAPDTPRSLDVLRGKTVALYSLNAGALERARSALLEEVTNIQVKCFSDTKGGGASLANAAKTADLFVIATAAATHAATMFIEQQRGTLPKRRVHRQGAAAMLDEVRKFAMDEAAAS